jgi:hypothetical protein
MYFGILWGDLIFWDFFFQKRKNPGCRFYGILNLLGYFSLERKILGVSFRHSSHKRNCHGIGRKEC